MTADTAETHLERSAYSAPDVIHFAESDRGHVHVACFPPPSSMLLAEINAEAPCADTDEPLNP